MAINQEGVKECSQPTNYKVYQKHQIDWYSLWSNFQLYTPANYLDCSIDLAPTSKPAPKYCDITGLEVFIPKVRPSIKIAWVDFIFMTKMLVHT